MSTPNPLVPQGTFQDKGKSHIRIAVFTILAVHVVLLSALLIAGCKRTVEETPPAEQTSLAPPPAPIEPPPLPPPLDIMTNVPAPAPIETVVPPPPPPPTENVVPPPPEVTPPPIVTPPEPVPTTPGTEHVIVKGDTFSALAKKYGVSVNAIKSANPSLDPNRLRIGDKVIIPPATAKPEPAGTGTSSGTAGEGTVYKVKSGDTLTRIGRQYGVTVKELRAANNLKTDQIKVGQRLKIPVNTPPPEPAPAAVPFTPPSSFPPGNP